MLFWLEEKVCPHHHCLKRLVIYVSLIYVSLRMSLLSLEAY